jgi:predicted lysophospholipase L1 biosynthesis ABC-type transport system permease subunit
MPRHGQLEDMPNRAQLAPRKLLRMSAGSLRIYLVSSLLQIGTVAATATFLVFVLGAIATMKTADALRLRTANPNAESEMDQLMWMLVVALLVCAISNVTSMLLSVSKRFREIGTMKCLGAFDTAILRLFLMEAFILCGIGAAAGSLLGALLSLSVAFLQHGGSVFTGDFLLQHVYALLITLAVVIALSIAGAAYPSWKASRMLPIEAMRTVG